MRDDLGKEGYSKEEEYFNKLNQELLEKLKKKDENRKVEKTENEGSSD